MEKNTYKGLKEARRQHDLKVFGYSFAAGMSILTFVLFHKQVPYYFALIPALLAVVHLIGALFTTKILIPMRFFTKTLVYIIGTILNFVFFSIFYYILFVPIALIIRLSGKDQIAKKSLSPHWEDIPLEENDPQRVMKQF